MGVMDESGDVDWIIMKTMAGEADGGIHIGKRLFHQDSHVLDGIGSSDKTLTYDQSPVLYMSIDWRWFDLHLDVYVSYIHFVQQLKFLVPALPTDA